MRWFKDPPCISMRVSLHDFEAGRLELDESGLDRLWNAGLFTTVGTFMAGVGLKVARWTPGTMKLVPLAVATAGGAAATLGVMSGLAHHNISFERDRGVRLRWRFGKARPHELRIANEQIAAFEVVRRNRTKRENEIDIEETYYLLMLVTKDGKAIALEEFGTKTQARLRQQLVEQVLGRSAPAVDATVDEKTAPAVEPEVKPAPKKTAARSRPAKKSKTRPPRSKKKTSA